MTLYICFKPKTWWKFIQTKIKLKHCIYIWIQNLWWFKNSNRPRSCASCPQTKVIDCASCPQTKVIDCASCPQTKVIDCASCLQTKVIDCVSCPQTKVIDCASCSQTKVIDCTSCPQTKVISLLEWYMFMKFGVK